MMDDLEQTMDDGRCANAACTCGEPAGVVRNGRSFCSGSCAVQTSLGPCGCGHDGGQDLDDDERDFAH